MTRTEPCSGVLAVAMTGVPEGSPIELDFRLEAVMEGVLVTGTAKAAIEAECARCLDPITDSVEAEFQELFRYHSDDDLLGFDKSADAEAEDEDYYLEDDLIDLQPVVRDAIVLALPLSPLCEEDCPGLCAECGAKLREAGPDHGHSERVDPRWEALRRLGEQPGDR